MCFGGSKLDIQGLTEYSCLESKMIKDRGNAMHHRLCETTHYNYLPFEYDTHLIAKG